MKWPSIDSESMRLPELDEVMRLLNTNTFKLEEFFNNVPKYGILSHRWRDEEVTLQDMEKGGYQNMKGWKKIEEYCKQVGSGHRYVWVDTCCIDKKSSAELQEAINSMFGWYRDSEMCHIFMDDVGDLKEFENSEWFGRGWTLQELLAPRFATFYGSRWENLGTRDTLAARIAASTGIEVAFLTGDRSFTSASIAKRMFWASTRKTTRLEDRAYSLLGIFDVSMPIIYGEGERSFVRLQEEILKVSDDHSLFTWDGVLGGDSQRMIARSPDSFRRKDIRNESTLFAHMLKNAPSAPPNQDFMWTNLGIRVYLPISRVCDFEVINVGKCPLTHKYKFVLGGLEGTEPELTVTVGRSEVTKAECCVCEENASLFYVGMTNCSTQDDTAAFFLMRKIMGTSNRYEKVHIPGYCFATKIPQFHEFKVFYVR
jgi:hypothetical protein